MSFKYAAFFAGCVLVSHWSEAATRQTYVAREIRTNAVDWNGERRDKETEECIQAENASLAQASFQTRIIHHEDDDERRCWVLFDDYAEYAPGILEPRKACLHSFVKSVGGPGTNNKRGHLQCAMDYERHDNEDEGVLPGIPGRDAKAVIAVLPADVTLEREKRSLITLAVPLRTIQFSIDKSIREKKNTNLPAGFGLEVKGSGFRAYAIDSRSLEYALDLDITGPGIGARCDIRLRFAIPAASPDAFTIQDLGTTVDCRTGAISWLNLAEKLSSAIRSSITQSLGKSLGGDNFSEWVTRDPDLFVIFKKALVQGRYCEWRGEQALCVAVGWRQPTMINAWELALFGRLPDRAGPVDQNAAQQKLRRFAEETEANHEAEVNGVRFPTGRFANGDIEDGDMALFGGLLCRSGEQKGCKLLRDAYTPDGRFWRSPRRKGEEDTSEHASFSGDQLKGLLHYFSTVQDRGRLITFLRYLTGNPTQIPSPSIALETGYSACPNYGPNFTCLISGGDWYALRLLARRYKVESELPTDLVGIEARYGFSYDTLVWEALMTPSGYRLHLVANTAWILRSLGETDPRLDRVFRILAARQPQNPFFSYLLLGPDRRVQQLADDECTLPLGRSDFSDWAWQRSDNEHAWERSMVWDCQFIYKLLTRSSLRAKVPFYMLLGDHKLMQIR